MIPFFFSNLVLQLDGEWCIVMTGRDDDEDKCRYMAIDKATQYASLDGKYFVQN